MNIEITEQEDPNIITDSLGRKIKLKEITGKSRLAFARALGPKDGMNASVINELTPVMAVDEIDGRKQGAIKGIADVEFIHGELDKGDAIGLVEDWLIERAEEKRKKMAEMADYAKK